MYIHKYCFLYSTYTKYILPSFFFAGLLLLKTINSRKSYLLLHLNFNTNFRMKRRKKVHAEIAYKHEVEFEKQKKNEYRINK